MPHSVTGETLAKLMFELQAKYFKGSREITFLEGEKVYARDYQNSNKKCWVKGVIDEVLSLRTYLVKVEDRAIWKRHMDQSIQTGDLNLSNKEIDNKITGELEDKESNDMMITDVRQTMSRLILNQ
ncbi:hypothetical protein ILUMI_05964 [Ignelater luminosus]|uniref:Uncharacterized protein n=1 Tax=Ignelater luminosus TaxID=2038154 RepID=A0A8K0DA65_IGNLU|nr:hypothetical protein ILUMI_05964 [Ignelater luminosus]